MLCVSIMEWKSVVLLLSVLYLTEITSYQLYYLEDASVCSSSKRTIKMNSRSSALLIQLSKYPHVSEYAIDCHLEIEAPKNQGLQVIVEDINLRRNSYDGECDDYVWFGRDDDGILSKKLCGQRKLAPISDLMSVSREAESNQNEHNLNLVEALIPEGPEATTFNDPGGELHIWFRKTSRKVNQTVQPLRLKVVITAYKQTCKTNDTQLWPCTPGVDKSSKYQEKCIPISLKCDGHVNCGAGFFSDESDCSFSSSSSSSAIGTASLVILGAVALLILCLMASMVCFCRRRKARLRRARRCQEECRVATVPLPHHSEVVAMERWREPASCDSEEGPTKGEEDPPPSYSELFPNYAAIPQQATDSN